MDKNTKRIVINSTFKIVITLIVIVGFITATILILILNTKTTREDLAILKIAGRDINLEVANTPLKQTQGLMNRTELSEDSGMIFVFEDEEPRTFWMKNTLISLDIIFLNSNFEVVKIHENTLINQTEIIYPSEAGAKFVIELNGGLSEKLGIKEGDTLNLVLN